MLRVSKSGVVTAWRERERQLRRARGRPDPGGRGAVGGGRVAGVVHPGRRRLRRTGADRRPAPESVPLRSAATVAAARIRARWDLIDMHEEPFGLAVGRGAAPPLAAGPGRPLHLLVGPEHREAVSAAVPVVGAGCAAPGGGGLPLQLRGGAGSSGGRGSRASGCSFPWAWMSIGSGRRIVRRPPAPCRSGSSAASSPTRVSTSCSCRAARRPVEGRDLRCRPRVRAADGHGRLARHQRPGDLPRLTSTRSGYPRSTHRSTWWPCPRSRCPAGSSSSAGWWSRPRRRVSRWWPAPAVPCPTSSAMPGCWCRPSDPAALGAALARFLDEPGLWARLRQSGMAEVGRYSWKSIAVAQMALYRAVTSGSPTAPAE